MSNNNVIFEFQAKASKAIPELLTLRKTIFEQGKTYLKIYTQKDLRSDFFVNLSMLLTKTTIDIDNFDVTREKLNVLWKLVPSGEANFLFQLDTINRRCFMTEMMFNVEFFMNSLRFSLQPLSKAKVFGRINIVPKSTGLPHHKKLYLIGLNPYVVTMIPSTLINHIKYHFMYPIQILATRHQKLFRMRNV